MSSLDIPVRSKLGAEGSGTLPSGYHVGSAAWRGKNFGEFGVEVEKLIDTYRDIHTNQFIGILGAFRCFRCLSGHPSAPSSNSVSSLETCTERTAAGLFKLRMLLLLYILIGVRKRIDFSSINRFVLYYPFLQIVSSRSRECRRGNYPEGSTR